MAVVMAMATVMTALRVMGSDEDGCRDGGGQGDGEGNGDGRC